VIRKFGDVFFILFHRTLVTFSKGQRVFVKGYLLENDEIVALSVQKK